MGDFIPEDAPVRLISGIVEQLDLKEVHDSYSKSSDGHPPYNPVMLLKVVLFGYMNNIFSMRRLEDAMRRDAHLIWLSSYQFPDHTTISRFKTRCMLRCRGHGNDRDYSSEIQIIDKCSSSAIIYDNVDIPEDAKTLLSSDG